MKKEDFLSPRESTGSSENEGEDRQQQKTPATPVLNNPEEETEKEAGLGRYLMAGIDDLEGRSRRDDYAGSDHVGMTDENINHRKDR